MSEHGRVYENVLNWLEWFFVWFPDNFNYKIIFMSRLKISFLMVSKFKPNLLISISPEIIRKPTDRLLFLLLILGEFKRITIFTDDYLMLQMTYK